MGNPRDIWRDVWGMLERLFTRTEIGYKQARLELEKFKSQQNRERFSNRGKVAAEMRWSKPLTTAEQHTSNAQAMLTVRQSPISEIDLLMEDRSTPAGGS
jgi:hypothetical protein